MSKKPDDDLFKDSVMTFGEHLEELRGCLWRAILGIVIGFVLGLFVAGPLVRFIQSPLEKALQRYYLQTAEQELRRVNPNATDDDLALVVQRMMVFDDIYLEPRQLSAALREAFPDRVGNLDLPAEAIAVGDVSSPELLAERLKEHPTPAVERIYSQLSKAEREAVDVLAGSETPPADAADKLAAALNRLLSDATLYETGAFATVSLSEQDRADLAKAAELSPDRLRHLNWTLLRATFPGQIVAPHTSLLSVRQWRPIVDDPRTRTRALSSQEAFMIWLKAALIAGLVLAGPWVFYQVWMFVAAGLYPHERRFVHVYLPFSIGLFILGVFMSGFVFKPILNFFLGFNRSMGIDPEPRISEWLSFVLFLPLGFGLAFQLPIVMLFLERIGVFTVGVYLKHWRLAVLVIWIIAAVATPSDPISIFYLAVPLMALFFGGIIICKLWPSERNRQALIKKN
jgi:sec-independent protein translocase protein TatC